MSKIRFVQVIVKKANRKTEVRFVNGHNVLRTVETKPIKRSDSDQLIRSHLLNRGLISGH